MITISFTIVFVLSIVAFNQTLVAEDSKKDLMRQEYEADKAKYKSIIDQDIYKKIENITDESVKIVQNFKFNENNEYNVIQEIKYDLLGYYGLEELAEFLNVPGTKVSWTTFQNESSIEVVFSLIPKSPYTKEFIASLPPDLPYAPPPEYKAVFSLDKSLKVSALNQQAEHILDMIKRNTIPLVREI